MSVTSASTYPALQIAGQAAASVGPALSGTGNGNPVVIVEASQAYVTFGAQIDGLAVSLVKRLGDAFSNSAVMSIRGSVRIQGW